MMSLELEQVDIQEVFHEVAEGKLVPVPLKVDPLEYQVRLLEHSNGDIEIFDFSTLFAIEQALALPENKELRKRWDRAISTTIKVKMRLLRLRALNMLEKYENKSPTSSAPDIAYCKTILADVLAEGTERVKAQFGYRALNTVRTENDEADEIAEQLEGRND
jgi:hypothetical protein